MSLLVLVLDVTWDNYEITILALTTTILVLTTTILLPPPVLDATN